METNFIKLYLDANKTLCKTLSIKSETSIDLINTLLKLKYGESSVDSYNPYSWKYYLNVSGEYHFTDTPMTIISLDTLTEIVFSKANLAIHTATAEAYRFGTRYYYNLLNNYPEQEQLILGILYPCDINKAVEAEDGSILSYPSYLVEPQEITLIKELEDFIKLYIGRWDVKAFGLVESLYPAAQHAIMYLNILPKLLNLRLKRCKTYEAHSFHVREYLASHGKLDRYLPYMTLKQALFLYRNINYIERNSGKTEQFSILVDRLLTDRRIPLNEFSIRHLNSFDDKYYPDINVRRKPVNPQYNVPEKDYFDLDLLYHKERPLVYGNNRYFMSNEYKITKSFKNSSSSIMQSKDLESSMIDYNDSIYDTLEEVLLRQWAYMSYTGLYRSIVTFKDPKTLAIRTLDAYDAFIYMLYISLRSINIHTNTLTTFINLKQRRHPLPSIEDMMSIIGNKELLDIIVDIRTNQPILSNTYSISSFFNISYSIYEEARRQWMIMSSIQDLDDRGYVANAINRLYEHARLELNIDDMDSWLYSHNLPTYNYTYNEAQELIKEIFTKSTGLNIDDSKLLKNIQKAMISVLSQLSSYTIQFITEINQSKIKPINWSMIRLGTYKNTAYNYEFVPENIRVIQTYGFASIDLFIESNVNKHYDNIEQSIKTHGSIDVGLVTTLDVKEIRLFDVYNSTTYVTEDGVYDTTDEVFLNWSSYNDLTIQQKQSILSIY